MSSVYEKGIYENYKPIARSLGMTVPKLKTILTDEQLLSGTTPTQTALTAQTAVEETITSDRYGTNKRILWHVPTLRRVFQQRGLKILEGDEKLLHIENMGQAIYRIKTAAERMNDLLELKYAGNAPDWLVAVYGKNEADKVSRRAADGLAAVALGCKDYAKACDQKEFRSKVLVPFEAAFEIGANIGGSTGEQIDFCRRLIEAACNWATTRKLRRFNAGNVN